MPDERYRRFTTTRWSLILAAADPRSSSAHEALSSLCEIYWMPVYAFVRRTGASVEDARDLTQAFFTTVSKRAISNTPSGNAGVSGRSSSPPLRIFSRIVGKPSARSNEEAGKSSCRSTSTTASGDINWSRPTR